MENELVRQVNDCLQNENFKKLPVSMIYRILSKSDKKSYSNELLFDFIKQNIEKYYILFTFLDILDLKDDKVIEFEELMLKSDNGNMTHYLQYLPFEIKYNEMKELRESNKKYAIRQKEIEDENERLKNQIDQMKQHNENLESQMSQKVEEIQNNKAKQSQLEQTNDKLINENKFIYQI